jgi:hypothetical protein
MTQHERETTVTPQVAAPATRPVESRAAHDARWTEFLKRHRWAHTERALAID